MIILLKCTPEREFFIVITKISLIPYFQFVFFHLSLAYHINAYQDP